MLKDLTADNIYIVCGHTDMRKSIGEKRADEIMVIIERHLGVAEGE